jgi:hypothetical protein
MAQRKRSLAAKGSKIKRTRRGKNVRMIDGLKFTRGKDGLYRSRNGITIGHTWDQWVQKHGYVGFSLPGRYFQRPGPASEPQTQPQGQALSEQENERLRALLAAMREEGY